MFVDWTKKYQNSETVLAHGNFGIRFWLKIDFSGWGMSLLLLK